MSADLHVVVPGPIDQRTGGYIYDERVVQGLRKLGWRVVVHSLEGTFPEADVIARKSMVATLAGCPAGDRVLIDGLAMGTLPGPLRAEQARLRLLSLVHHPLADETGIDAERRLRFERLEREALGACAGVVVTSEFTAKRLESYGVDADRIRVVHPGTDPAPQAAGPASGDPPCVLCVGAVTPRKAQADLVRALADQDDLAWHCLCVGSLDFAPVYATSVRQLIDDCDLRERVRLAGACGPEELGAFYDGASLFVLPSHYEGYGMAFSEALARGLGIVSTTGGAIPFTVPPGARVLVPPGDVPALGRALRGLLTEPAGPVQRAAMAAEARRCALTLPSWHEAAERFADATRELTPDGDV